MPRLDDEMFISRQNIWPYNEAMDSQELILLSPHREHSLKNACMMDSDIHNHDGIDHQVFLTDEQTHQHA